MATILKRGSDKTTIKNILKKFRTGKSKKGLDASKYAGRVQFNEDGLAFQKRVRDEWEYIVSGHQYHRLFFGRR